MGYGTGTSLEVPDPIPFLLSLFSYILLLYYKYDTKCFMIYMNSSIKF